MEELEEETEIVKEVDSFEGSMDMEGNPFEDDKLVDMNEGEFEQYVNGLMKWCDSLDFDGYIDTWYQIATSAPFDYPDFEPLEEEVYL